MKCKYTCKYVLHKRLKLEIFTLRKPVNLCFTMLLLFLLNSSCTCKECIFLQSTLDAATDTHKSSINILNQSITNTPTHFHHTEQSECGCTMIEGCGRVDYVIWA